MLVQRVHEALDGFSAAVEPLVGPAWREVPAFTLFFGAIFLASLPLWRYVVGLDSKKATVLASCCMSSVHGLLSALGEQAGGRVRAAGAAAGHTRAACKECRQAEGRGWGGSCATVRPPCCCPAGGYEQLMQWQGFKLDLPNTHPQASAFLCRPCLLANAAQAQVAQLSLADFLVCVFANDLF